VRIGVLFFKELRFRPGGFLLGLVATAAVAACVVGARGLLAAHDHKTERLVSGLQERAAERMAKLRDEARVFSKSLGFNILLLPEEQDLGQLYTENRSTHFFSPAQIEALGTTDFTTLNHLLPVLRYRVHWDAYGRDVILVGVEGEIFIKAPRFQKPIEERIEPGDAHVGDAICRQLKLSVGDMIELLGEHFTIRRILPQKGNVDDISILMNLGDAQRLSGLPDKISGILALSCNCAAGDLASIRTELSPLLPNVQVVEFTIRARARQRARDAIGAGTREETEDITSSRGAVRDQVTRFAAILISLVAAGTVVLLVVLTAGSARERRAEVAMLRALGLGAARILSLFLYKAMLMGVAGSVFGCLAGLLAARAMAGPAAVVSAPFLVAVIVVAPLVATVASAVPAAAAANTDPAVILNQE